MFLRPAEAKLPLNLFCGRRGLPAEDHSKQQLKTLAMAFHCWAKIILWPATTFKASYVLQFSRLES